MFLCVLIYVHFLIWNNILVTFMLSVLCVQIISISLSQVTSAQVQPWPYITRAKPAPTLALEPLLALRVR